MAIYICTGERKIEADSLPPVFPSITISLFDAESNSTPNGLILMDGNSFCREKLSLRHHIWPYIYGHKGKKD
jgi:hypothetical protein